MKTLARSLLIYAVTLWLVNQLVAGINFARGNETIFLTAVALGAFNLFLRPLLNLLLLPINILTLGTLRWVVNVVTLYVLTVVIPGFQVSSFYFPGYSFQGLSLPAWNFGIISAYILISFLISLISGFLFWLEK